MAPNMAPMVVPPAANPVPSVANYIPGGRNGVNSYFEDATDVVTFATAIALIVLPDNYDCKEIVDPTGNVQSYMLSTKLGLIAAVLTEGGLGRLTLSMMAAYGTLRQI